MSPHPIAIHLGSDVIRMMQIGCSKRNVLHNAMEVASGDYGGISEALSSFKGKGCVASISSEDVLVQHIRVPIDIDEKQIIEQLVTHDKRWGDAELRKVCVTTTGGSAKALHEILCVGIQRVISKEIVDELEAIGLKVVAVTVPLYASIRAFDKLYRRDGDGKMTSMLIDMDDSSSIVMIAHGANCVFAHRLDTEYVTPNLELLPRLEVAPSLIEIANTPCTNLERRTESNPRGLCGVNETNGQVESEFTSELEKCLRHHDALFPNRAVERVIFTGRGANDNDYCGAVASQLELQGYIADPSAWIESDCSIASGPSWTTAAGMCMRYSELAA